MIADVEALELQVNKLDAKLASMQAALHSALHSTVHHMVHHCAYTVRHTVQDESTIAAMHVLRENIKAEVRRIPCCSPCSYLEGPTRKIQPGSTSEDLRSPPASVRSPPSTLPALRPPYITGGRARDYHLR